MFEQYDMGADNPEWYQAAFKKFVDEGVTDYFSASYGVPDEVINKFK